MHWFWRAAIAVIVGFAGSLALSVATYAFLTAFVAPPNTSFLIGLSITRSIVPLIIAVCVYGLLTARYGPKAHDRETRCRECGYILRGITEPRCPECGERI
ncbi:MAG: hypothetical protein JSV19_12700 [Phycisphaerales bacterium]|nr:MAG: hypothetical protein JSV19_12700 [Phycisphaerales bacterium]